MAKLMKVAAVAALLAGVMAMPGAAQARWHHGWHGGGWGGGSGFALGFGYPYYGSPYYAAQPACGWAPVRVWRHGHWMVRRTWRCW